MPTTAERTIRDQRGVAMVLTLLILLILAALAMAFAMLGASEPQIVANLQQSAEAMGLAEAGIEGVIWALNNPTVAPGGLAFPLPTTIPDPYNGNTDIGLGTGVFRVSVTAGATSSEALVTSEGRVPNWASPRATRIVKATVARLPNLDPPCAACVKEDLSVQNNTIIDSRTSTCGSKKAAYSTAAVSIRNLGVHRLHGLFSNDGQPNIPNQGTDFSRNLAASTFGPFTLTQAQLDLLKDLAKANGSYYQGAVTLSGSLPDGVIFVDTVSGNPIDSVNPLDFGSLTLTGNMGAAKGWIVVMGNLSIGGEGSYSGLLYVGNTLTYSSTVGAGNSLSGGIIVQNVSSSATGASFTTSDTITTTIQYHCDNVKTAGGTYPAFFVRPGSWREISN